MDLTTTLVLSAAIVATWDSFRRYFDTAKFNREAIDKLGEVARDAAELRAQLQTVKERLALSQGARANSNPLRIGK